MRRILLLIFFGFSVWGYSYFILPDAWPLIEKNPEKTAFMKRYKGTPKHHWVPYSKISSYLKEAIIFAEDGNFFLHHGVDWNAILEAAKRNFKKKRLAVGGSTITQQLAKNLYLSPSRNPLRKIKEMLIAFKLERSLSKQRILELYLNYVEWGNGIYGAEAAANHYFGIHASQLGPEEAAWLASILPNPRFYDRHGVTRYLDRKMGRVLRRID